MNKTKRVAAHKHRAHIRKTKEKRRLAMGPAGMAAEAAKRRAPKKETEAVAEVRRKPASVTESAHADRSAAVKEKAHKEHKPSKKTADSSDGKAAENTEAHAKKAKTARAAVKTDKPEEIAETPAGEHHKTRKPKTDSE